MSHSSLHATITLLAASAGLALAVACGSDRTGFEDPGPTSEGDGGIGPVLGGDTDAAGQGTTCSSDLHSVLDDKGVVVKTCPDDTGCAGGQCVPACNAAAASHGTVGCDYVVTTPSFYPGIAPPCFAVFLANNWSRPVKVTVSRDGTNYDVTTFGRIPVAGQPESAWQAVPATGIPPGQVGVLFMSSDPSSQNGGQPLKCPVSTAVNAGTAVSGTGKGKAWHISTDFPVTAYDILPYGGAKSFLPSAELIIPTTAWGTNYFGILPRRGNSAPQWGQIVASKDGTQVQIVPNVNLPAGNGVPAAPQNQVATFTLNAGEYVQWQESGEMSSSIISANNPIAFVGGQGYLCYSSATSSGGGCDSAHQQVPPISAMGSEYVGTPYATRRQNNLPESIFYRLVGTVDGTTLTFDPAIPGAPATLNKGQVVDFETASPFKVASQDAQHPFFVAQTMAGCTVQGGSRGGAGCLGDEESVNVLPPAQFLKKYVFFTDPTYPTTNLVFTRVKTAAGFKDVNVDCLGVITGWKPVDQAGNYEITNADLVREGQGQNGCQNGPHVASSDGPFGLTVWGLDTYSSYAYPAGGNVATINQVVVPPVPR
jgi:hypothetical protein